MSTTARDIARNLPTYHLASPVRRNNEGKTNAPISLAPVIVTADAVIAAGMLDQ